ncbi:unnamed protein product [Linum tenue]|uniref:FAD-binding PCMH-type domain-containing protein n=1 Tax=Linum tenue TaxID=586396 RepID=A0AAV0QLB1_9ROSI|nr:unnamed protein product [Linum tenue]
MARVLPILLILIAISFPYLNSADRHSHEESILECLYSQNYNNTISQVTFTPTNSSYDSILQFSIKNSRFNTSASPKPVLIVTPDSIPQIQTTILCSKKHKFQIRIRSGGHDYEGLSYTSPDHNSSFLILDLISFRNISIDLAQQTAWIQPAVTTGELYYRIAEKSSTLAFPSGICPTWGTLLRKYGLAADNVLDTRVIDAEGRILDRASMGEDMFWAIRGGGGNTFGIVIAWKIKLVPVPASVTACTVTRTLEQNATEIVHRSTGSAKFKGKSDYVKEPIPISGFEGIWEKLKEVGVQTGGLILASYGGKMSEIPESSIPFPHRAGNIYQVEEVAFWVEDGVEAADGYLNWLRGLYEYMTPYVSKNPREAYANYRDLDIGRNGGGGEGDYRRARSWGSSYYKNNFDRLVRVKTAVDPANFFRNEQSIPPLSSWR